MKIAEVKTWGYQLQNANPDVIAHSPYDLMVVDMERETGSSRRMWTPVEINAMRTKPDGSSRIVLAYLSIGEAEDYRTYWQPQWKHVAPMWLGRENPDWPGNYLVRFWLPPWQQIIFSQLDKIITAGFDGVYLDKIDAVEDWHASWGSHTGNEMFDFVTVIGLRGRTARLTGSQGFLVVPQNGDGLLDRHAYRRQISAFARDDLLFNEDGTNRAGRDLSDDVTQLNLLRNDGKPVLVVEYPHGRERAAAALKTLAGMHFIGQVAPRALDRISF